MIAADGGAPELVRIVLAGAYPRDDLDRLIADLDPLKRLTRPALVEIDITELTEICHAGVAWLLVLIVQAEHLGLLVHCFIVDARKDEQNSLI